MDLWMIVEHYDDETKVLGIYTTEERADRAFQEYGLNHRKY